MRRDQESTKLAINNRIALTRRDVLQRTAWIIAAAGLPLGTELYAQDVNPVMAALSKYMSEARDRALGLERVKDVGELRPLLQRT